MTIAPERPGATGPGGVGQTLLALGALPSFGHTDATAEVVEAAIAEAAQFAGPERRSARATATHLFNGRRPMHHRDPGPALACLAGAGRGDLVVELIADGVHLAPAMVAEVFALLGPDAIVLVTDAMAAAGMPDGAYVLGSLAVTVDGGVARLADGASIAGGTAHLLDVVRHTVLDSGIPLADAVAAASLTPARVLGMEHEIGSLQAGTRADIVLTDASLHPQTVYRSGTQAA
jgi:N-acetylglucosamine-6-phosphate deacetylase